MCRTVSREVLPENPADGGQSGTAADQGRRPIRRLRLACHHSPQFDTVRPLCPPKPGPDHLLKCSKSPHTGAPHVLLHECHPGASRELAGPAGPAVPGLRSTLKPAPALKPARVGRVLGACYTVSSHSPNGGVFLTGSFSVPVRAFLSASALPGRLAPGSVRVLDSFAGGGSGPRRSCPGMWVSGCFVGCMVETPADHT